MSSLKPKALKPGDTIGIVSPSSPVPDEELKQGIEVIEARGYRVELGKNVLAAAAHCNYLAGTDAQRAADLNEMLTRPDIDAVFCARGGYGAMRLFSLLDWDNIKRSPKVFLGYSDITSLHIALGSFGWTTIHATMVSSLTKLDNETSELWWKLVESAEPVGTLPANKSEIEVIVSGVAEGTLTGGNLTLLSRACGSRFTPDFNGKIVMLEDVNSAVYHADRDLMQLLNAGALDGVAGFVIGALTGWEKHEEEPPKNTPSALWKDFFGTLGKPTIANYPFGHIPNALPIPLGVQARLDATDCSLTTLEAAVSL